MGKLYLKQYVKLLLKLIWGNKMEFQETETGCRHGYIKNTCTECHERRIKYKILSDLRQEKDIVELMADEFFLLKYGKEGSRAQIEWFILEYRNRVRSIYA